uniref:Putative secreted protein n=1 Tax=Anopheles marajoara TaxID=58244 RepID=A0A2M4C877_9DIPT
MPSSSSPSSEMRIFVLFFCCFCRSPGSPGVEVAEKTFTLCARAVNVNLVRENNHRLAHFTGAWRRHSHARSLSSSSSSWCATSNSNQFKTLGELGRVFRMFVHL